MWRHAESSLSRSISFCTAEPNGLVVAILVGSAGHLVTNLTVGDQVRNAFLGNRTEICLHVIYIAAAVEAAINSIP